MLSSDELGLFRERVRFLDRKIEPGMTRLLWLSQGASKHFINDSLPHVDKVEHKSAGLLFVDSEYSEPPVSLRLGTTITLE